LKLDPASKSCDLSIPEITIDLGDRDYFDTEPFLITVQLPYIFTILGIQLAFDEAYHLPNLVYEDASGIFAAKFPP
jgi:hypothetical protein